MLARWRAPFIGLNLARDSGDATGKEATEALNVSLEKGTIQKRPGTVERVSLFTGSILGIFDYLKADSSKEYGLDPQLIVKAGVALYRISAWSPVEIGTFPAAAMSYMAGTVGPGSMWTDAFDVEEIGSSIGLSATELMSFAMVNNRVYFCDSEVFKVTDGTDVYEAQITPPGSSGSAAAGAAGKLTGRYDYKVTWYSSTWGQESPSAAATSTVDVIDQQVDLSSLPSSAPDARVDAKRLYRRKVSSFEADWYFVAELTAAATTYTDDVQDVDRDLTKVAPLSYSTTLPAPRFLCYQADVLFAGGFDDYPTRIYYTRVGQPWTMDRYIEIGSGHDTDRVTGLSAFQGMVVVYKERSIWLLTGTSPETFYWRKVAPGAGCRSHHSIVSLSDRQIFLGEDGFYSFDGATVTKVGAANDRVGDILRSRNTTRDRYCVGAVDPERGVALWALSSAGSAENDQVLCFWYNNSLRVEAPSWTRWVYPEAVSYLAYVTNSSTFERNLVLGYDTGALMEATGDDDDGDSITMDWTTADIHAGEPDHRKQWGELTVQVKEQSVASNLEMHCILEDATSSSLATFDQTRPVGRTRVGRASRRIRLRFYAASTSPVQIDGYALEAFRAGRR